MSFRHSSLCLAFAAITAGSTTFAAPLTLEDVLEQVRQNNATVLMAARETGMMKAREEGSGLWADPTVEIMAQRDDDNRPLALSATELTLRQELPLGGRLSAERVSAQAETQERMALQRLALREAITAAQDAFYELARSQFEKDTLLHHKSLLEKALVAYRIALEAGNGKVGGLLSLETEKARQDQRLIEVEAEAARAKIELNRLRGAAPFDTVELAPLPEAENAPPLSRDEILARAEAAAPEFDVSQAQKEQARRALELARAERLPKAELSFRTRHLNRSGKILEDYDTGLMVSIPWLHAGRYRAAQREAQARQAMAEATEADFRARLHAEVSALLVRRDAALAQLKFQQQTQLPLAEKSVEIAADNLTTGAGSVLELLEALRAQRDTNLTELQARIELQKTTARLLAFLERNASPQR